MKVEVIRERRKTVVLTLIDAENAVLKVPQSLSDKKVSQFLADKKRWLERKASKVKENEEFSKEYQVLKYFYLFGKRVDLFSNLIFGFDELSEQDKVLAVRKAYLTHFSNLEKLAKLLSLETGLGYEKIKPIDSVRVWGSYSSVRIMKLNWRLLILPENLVRYVICHELCHSKHMNHKPQFWKEVSRYCPEYKKDREELKRFAFLLKYDI